jgi:hypothetical protein
MTTAVFEKERPTTSDVDLVELLREIERYLAAVDEFRREGREPCWARETPWLRA